MDLENFKPGEYITYSDACHDIYRGEIILAEKFIYEKGVKTIIYIKSISDPEKNKDGISHNGIDYKYHLYIIF